MRLGAWDLESLGSSNGRKLHVNACDVPTRLVNTCKLLKLFFAGEAVR